MAELHETRMGKTLIDHTFPKIAKQLERIADTLEYIENSFTHNNGKDSHLKHYEMISLCASEGLEQDKDFEQVGTKWRRI